MANVVPISSAGFGSQFGTSIAVTIVVVLVVIVLVLVVALHWRKVIGLVMPKNSQKPEKEKALPPQPGHAKPQRSSSWPLSKRSHSYKSSTASSTTRRNTSLDEDLLVERANTQPTVELASAERKDSIWRTSRLVSSARSILGRKGVKDREADVESATSETQLPKSEPASTETKDPFWKMSQVLPRTIALLSRAPATSKQVEVTPPMREPQQPPTLKLSPRTNKQSSSRTSRIYPDKSLRLSRNLNLGRAPKGEIGTQQPESLQLPPIAESGDSSWRMSRFS